MSHSPVGKGLFLHFDNASIFDELTHGRIVGVSNDTFCWDRLYIVFLPWITITYRLEILLYMNTEKLDLGNEIMIVYSRQQRVFYLRCCPADSTRDVRKEKAINI